jgi:predicted transcriptional regulator
MTRIEKLQAAAAALSDDQIDALISLARSMMSKPFYDEASPDALRSIERGLDQVARGETVTLDELADRLARAARASDE